MKRKLGIMLVITLLVGLVSSTAVGFWIFGDDKEESGKVKIEFFQNKQEAVGTYDKLIKEFEEKNPNIDVEQNHVPEAETVLKSRLAKNDVPDIMALNANYTYGEIAEAGVLVNLSDREYLNDIQSSYLNFMHDLHEGNDTYGIPYSANANTVLYNKTKFKELGLDIPQTWDEFIAAAEKIEAAGETPFYLTFNDAWTIMVPWNSLAANLQGEDFIDQRKAGETTFQARYGKVAKRLHKLLDYGQDDPFGKGYNQGNKAFANGESVMYLQGIWAIGSIKKANPDIEIGAFALPAVNQADQNKLVSGVDTVVSISKQTEHKEAAEKFIKFLLQKENAEYYINQEKLFSAVKGVYQEDPQLVDLKKYFETGQIAPFPDHYYPSGMQVPNLIQEFLLEGEVDPFLKTLDKEWNKVQARQ